MNNRPAENVQGSGATYTFSFPQPQYGIVDITWDPGHGIGDLSEPPRPFDSTAASANWSYRLVDATPPTVTSISPPIGAIVRALIEVEIQFSEPVVSVDSADLLINGVGATGIVMRTQSSYLFRFAPPSPGLVTAAWALNHGISDFAIPANSFVGNHWTYTQEPHASAAQVIISEFLASAENSTGLKDEEGELQDWIELHNSGSTPANLIGWSLTDDPDDPNLWPLPAITLAPGDRIVIFASAKDRRSTAPGARLHTNFKLNSSSEYLALFNADSPRAAANEFAGGYPEQRNDYSYGWDGSIWHYYRNPTPGAANGSSPITGIVPKPEVSVKRGFFDAPFNLTISNRVGSSIRYTLDGSVPTEFSGAVYSAPLLVSNTTTLRAATFAANQLPSEIITHSYLFLERVIRQRNDPPGFPAGEQVMSGFPSDYEMDPEIVNDPAYASEIKAALQAFPTLSIVTKMSDMFGAANGIYTHPLNRGPQWERPCSIEFIPLDGKDFQAAAGIQIQGNAAREPIKQPKHPFRLVFKGDYGAKKLNERVFPDSPIDSFDTLIPSGTRIIGIFGNEYSGPGLKKISV